MPMPNSGNGAAGVSKSDQVPNFGSRIQRAAPTFRTYQPSDSTTSPSPVRVTVASGTPIGLPPGQQARAKQPGEAGAALAHHHVVIPRERAPGERREGVHP